MAAQGTLCQQCDASRWDCFATVITCAALPKSTNSQKCSYTLQLPWLCHAAFYGRLNSPILVQQSKSVSSCRVAFSCVEYCRAEKFHRAGQSLRSVDVFITLMGFAALCCFWVHRTLCYKLAATMVCPLIGAEYTQYWPPCLSLYLNIWRFEDTERCSRGKRLTSPHFCCAVKLRVDFTLTGRVLHRLFDRPLLYKLQPFFSFIHFWW